VPRIGAVRIQRAVSGRELIVRSARVDSIKNSRGFFEFRYLNEVQTEDEKNSRGFFEFRYLNEVQTEDEKNSQGFFDC